MKYRSVDTDFASLERELRGSGDDEREVHQSSPDPYEDLASHYDDVVELDEDDEAYGR